MSKDFRIKGTNIGYDVPIVIIVFAILIITMIKLKSGNDYNIKPDAQVNVKIDSIDHSKTSSTSELRNRDTFDYEGTITDEMGNSAHYKLMIKKDFSSASIGNGPFTEIRPLSDGRFQWISGSIIGISFNPQKNSCDLYNADGTYWSTLYRTNLPNVK
jgi:hypothetical protein